jgi:hypothetical protein
MKLKNVTKRRKNMILIKFSPTQIGGFLPALVSATIAVACGVRFIKYDIQGVFLKCAEILPTRLFDNVED